MKSPLRKWPLLLAFSLLVTARAAAAAGHPRLVILAVDRLTYDDLWRDHLPNLSRLVHEGATGLMTTRIPGGLSPERMYLTIGAGEPITGGHEARLAFNAAEHTAGMIAREEYFLQHGSMTSAGLVHLGLAALAGKKNIQPAMPGRLGGVLARGGLRLAVLGNADNRGRPGREAVAMLMDENGRVALGNVGSETLKPDWRFPGGWRTDYEVLCREYEGLSLAADVILIALGDPARLHEMRSVLVPEQAEYHRQAALRDIDGFIGFLLDERHTPSRIMLVVPSPPLSQVRAGKRLTPFVLWGGVTPGLAYSPGIRRPGIVSPSDLTATIAASCGIDATKVTLAGWPILSQTGDPAELVGQYAELVSNYNMRTPVFMTYGYAVILAVFGALVLAIYKGSDYGPAQVLRILLASLALTPVFFLVFAFLPLAGAGWAVLILIVSASVLTGLILMWLQPSPIKRLALLGLAVTTAVFVDILLGSPLLSRSLLGYSPISGARFYGLGNEYLGIVLGSSILGGAAFTALSTRRAPILLGTGFFLVALAIILPGYGANIGGGITAAIGLGYSYCLLTGRRMGWREGAVLALAVLVLLGFATLIDFWGTRGHLTHLGRTVLRMHYEGPLAVLLVARDKLLMNLRLLGYTNWTWAMLGLLILGPLALRYPPGWFPACLRYEHPLRDGMKGMIVAALAGLLVNDSGVVVAATILIYLGVALAYLPVLQRGREAGA